MAVRGGPVVHAVARAGWAVFGAFGALVMVVVALLYAANPGEHGADNEPPMNFLGGLIVFVPMGAVLFALLGLPVQFFARSWLRTPTEAERRSARDAQRAADPYTPEGLLAGGRWALSYQRCVDSVTAFHAIVETLPAGPGREWLTDIGSTLDDELREALRLARLGDNLAPGGRAGTATPARKSGKQSDHAHGSTPPAATSERIAELLTSAERAFASTTDRAGSVALDLRRESEFTAVRSQLDMLTAQTPHLRDSDF
ncbi:hypothetical protein FB384_002449 [Prauserella sediminis]|uniref:Uncharacterized protein n=2 Tax=Prauserella salsuginis group TaxID=2893672 RepID=A0A839XUP3_9PSEU|nr:hypothetical protein [Prauserella sediminis]MBB3663545.1 hypothetical protein [Prauserella sediminis]